MTDVMREKVGQIENGIMIVGLDCDNVPSLCYKERTEESIAAR
jgi:hypothetical protein